jgi:hypothetical protein
MAVLRLHKAAEEIGTGESTIAIESGCMSAELTEDSGAPNASLRQLPAPETIATNDSRPPTPPSQTFRSSLAWSGPATTSCVGPWTTLSGIATSGAGGPSGLQSGRGGGGSRAERPRCGSG